jgi:hypothetical protein
MASYNVETPLEERATSVSLMTSSSTYSWTSHSGGNSPISSLK